MAMKDLVIRPQTEALRYASHKFDELRFLLADIQKRRDVSEPVYRIAARGRAMALSAKVTIDNAIEEALGDAYRAAPNNNEDQHHD